MFIIDFHTHDMAASGPGPEIVACECRNNIDYWVDLGDVLRHGPRPDEAEIAGINDSTVRTMALKPERVFGACFLNPENSLEFCLQELETRVRRDGFKLAKLEISVNCRDPRLDPIMEKLIELDIPLVHHCWYLTTSVMEGASQPDDIAYLARRFPRARIIMAHLVGCDYRGVEAIAALENVWVDTSGSQPVAGLVEYAVDRLGAERVIFGSDVPCRNLACQMGKVLGARLPESAKELIMGLNARRLLKI